MSFRDTFTRDSSSSQNLQYDDTAAYHFLTTIIILIFVPLLYNILKTIINPFSFMPRLKQIEHREQFKQKIVKFKQENRYKFITCWFVFKVFLIVVMAFALVNCYYVLKESGDKIKDFDAYEILQVEPDAPVEKIKKAYRRLALRYHPDRNQDDPQANAKFMMISKAYECLTDEKAKVNCQKYGNPQGTSSFNVGIALPSFLVKKQNQVFIMGVVFFLVVIALPIFLIYYFGEVNKYDQYGMLQQSYPFVNGMLNQQLSIKDCVKCLAVCAEFKNLRINKVQAAQLQQILKNHQQDYIRNFLKKNYLNYIKKAIILIDQRINGKQLPAELMDDFKFIMKKVPILVKSIIMLSQQRSNEMIAKFRPELFVGGNAISSLIMFGQYFIQGKSLNAEPFQQIDFTQDQLDRIYKKKKKRTLSLTELGASQEDKQFLLTNMTPQRARYISEMIAYFPRLEEVETIVHVAGDKEITTMDNIEVIVNLKSNRKSNFSNSMNYPFLKMEGWWIMVLDRNYVVALQHFSFNKSEKHQFKCARGVYPEPGNYSLTVKVFSDCYFGLDVEKVVKFAVTPAKKTTEIQPETQDDLEEEQSFFDRIMKNVIPQEEQELSDQEEEAGKGNKQSKTSKGQKKAEETESETKTEKVQSSQN